MSHLDTPLPTTKSQIKNLRALNAIINNLWAFAVTPFNYRHGRVGAIE